MGKYNCFELVNTGHQDCADLHFWGPGIRQCYIIHYVKRGMGYLEVKGERYSVKEGECFITYPHSVIYYYPEEEDPWEYVWVDFVGENVDDYLNDGILNYKNPVVSPARGEELERYFDILQEMDIIEKNKCEANGILYAILGSFQDAGKKEHTKPMELVDTCVMFIHSRYHRSDFTTEDICKELGMSRSTLYRLFMKNFNMPPNQFLIEYRINQAKSMLDGKTMVKTVAHSCGYDDPLYFSRQFKKKVGVAPQDFRL